MLHSRQGARAIKGAEHAHRSNVMSSLAMTLRTDLTTVMMCLSVLQVECPVVPDAHCGPYQTLLHQSLPPSATEKENSVLPSSGLVVGHFLQRQDQGTPAQAFLVSNSGNGFGRVLVRAKRDLGCMTVLGSTRRGCLLAGGRAGVVDGRSPLSQS